MEKIEKKAILAIKIAITSIFIALFLSLLALWVLINQTTISVEIDKKLNSMQSEIENLKSRIK